ncbi:MAG: 2-dehydropantoate 2-reductase [Betaproteobacteria bacterium]|nr:2-dehydropantoate 2-reductase [Betaproteobacteria bacterium]
MRLLVYGAGAIGGFFGAMLTEAGEDVTLVARGAQYEALSNRGIILEGRRIKRAQPIRVRAVRPDEVRGPFDLIFVTLKAHQLAGAAEHIRTLGGKDAWFVFPQNGLPWWYFDGIDTRFRGAKLKSLDPDGVLSRTFTAENLVCGIAFKPSDIVEPGRIRLADTDADSLTVGELDNRMSERIQTIAGIASNAGWPGKAVTDIRKAKWNKLLSNAIWNPLCSLTQSNPNDTASYAPTMELAAQMINEVIAVAAAVGVTLNTSASELIAGAAKRAPIPPSTLQDVRAGRAMELDAILNSVIEMGQLAGVATPSLKAVAACANLLNQRIIHDGVAIQPAKLRA